MKKADKKVTVGMSQELYDTLKQMAEEDCRSVPSYIRLVLRDHLEKPAANTIDKAAAYGIMK